jgi:hypothetical protein
MDFIIRALTAAGRLPFAELRNLLLLIAAGLAVLAGTFRAAKAIIEYQQSRSAQELKKKLQQSSGAFTGEDIASSLRGYVEPDCAQTDPSNQTDLRLVADVREPVMQVMKRFVNAGGDRRYILLLADSGMGKTTFCLNFFARMQKENTLSAVIPLGRPDAVSNIKKVEAPSETILILDAFDEDPGAIEDSPKRMRELMEVSADFKSVIITCRSQFFVDDASIPSETGVAVIGPRRGGERGSYKFFKIYLLPFSQLQVDQYVKSHYPLWDLDAISKRSSARRLIRDIPELTVRPMLLALVPELIRSKKKIIELYDLYDFMVSQWLQRESRWIDPGLLLDVSKKIAVHMATSKATSNRDRIDVATLEVIAEGSGVLITSWKHLTARSLLNRDSEGQIKFAHRSIMEFLFVVAAIEGDQRCFEVYWTDMMRDLFVSWGSTAKGRKAVSRAREIIALDLDRIGLSPLSSPLPTPRRIDASEALGTVSSKRDVMPSRRAPLEWRKGSLRLELRSNVWVLKDYSYDLSWEIPDHRTFSDTGLSRLTYAAVAKMEAGEQQRLPSVEEFVSLAEDEKLLESEIIELDEYYWVGDQLGRNRSIVVRIGSEVTPDELLKTVGKREIQSRSGEPLWIYEVKMRVRAGGGGKGFTAMAAMVKEGESERARYRRGPSTESERREMHRRLTGLNPVSTS